MTKGNIFPVIHLASDGSRLRKDTHLRENLLKTLSIKLTYFQMCFLVLCTLSCNRPARKLFLLSLFVQCSEAERIIGTSGNICRRWNNVVKRTRLRNHV